MIAPMQKIDPTEPPPYCGNCGAQLVPIGFPSPWTVCIGSQTQRGCLSLVAGPGPLFFHRVSELDRTVPEQIIKGAEHIRAQIRARA
jgi:hypothetical protein